MRIYLAARWARKDEIAALADEFILLGFTVTSEWLWEPPGPASYDGCYEPSYLAELAIRNCRNIDDAVAVVQFADDPSVPQKGGGRHVEFGYGYCAGKRMILVGEPEHVFHHLPEVERASSFEDVVRLLRETRREAA